MTTPTTNNRSAHLAMLIDWENIKYATIDNLRTPPDILTLKKIARRFGNLRIGRAYANWCDPSGWHAGDVDRLANLGIEPVFVPSRRWHKGSEYSYERDLVDLRLACDGMELLASHPEIDCFVVVSGDGALETLLAKLAAAGKRIIRVGVSKTLTHGTRVLGEERVLYDEWIGGFRSAPGVNVQGAIDAFVTAVSELTAEGIRPGLDAVKIRIRGRQPEFEEENLGIPSFRHLAFLAESQGSVRIDAMSEPAMACVPGSARNGWDKLPSGKAWAQFIQSLDPNRDYTKPGLIATLGSDHFDGGLSVDQMVTAAINADVIVRFSGPVVAKDQITGEAKEIQITEFRLNIHHPRVQVVLSLKPHEQD